MVEFSTLRIVAILVGVAFIVTGLRSLRSHEASRSGIWLQFSIGLLAIALGLFPTMANLPADVLSLDAVPGGRLMTVLMITTGLLLVRIGSLSNSQTRLTRDLAHLLQAAMIEAFARRYEKNPPPSNTILVVLPCYNEADNLRELLPTIPIELEGRTILTLVVDDGSRDDSAEVAEANGALVVSHPVNMGGGRALFTGFAIARAMGAQIVVTMDSDGQHDPAEIREMIVPLLVGEADVVVGSRILGRHEAASRLRVLGVGLFSGLISILTGKRITDCASGFRAFDASVPSRLNLLQEQYHTAEFIIEACKAGLRVIERPITIRRRQHGSSKKGHDVFYGYRFAKVVTKSWLR
jgi:hypothetical protein